MVEAKQVKVDNWGIFFLQRLQQFYNKSSFCDLIIRFDDNVQIKVHRLVMNACTEYFQILEQTCLVEKDCIMMPSNLPSDVVIPVINFMYSGILEFHESSFDRLYSTAKLMNMSVLTKLLDAQKTPIKPLPKRVQSVTPITWNLQGRRITAKTYDPDLPETLPGRKLPIWKRKTIPSVPFITSNNFENFSHKIKAAPEEPPKPTRFEWPEEDSNFENSFDDISYESKPLLMPALGIDKYPKPSTSSTFEEIKRSVIPVKRSASPLGNQCKKVNIQDVKDYLKEHKIRSDYIDYDDAEMADNDLQTFDNEDSNDETAEVFTQNTEDTPNKSILKNDAGTTATPKHVRFSLDGKENVEKKVQPTPLKTAAKTSPSTPKPDQNTPELSKHTKIITEVLKKYPHLVKNNKNIRLKILQKGPSTPNTKATTKSSTPIKQTSKVSYKVLKPDAVQKTQVQTDGEQTWECTNCEEPQTFTSYLTYRQHLTEVHNEKQDSQMCNVCGHTSRKQNMLVYHKFVKHNIPPPAMYNFPKCKECNYVAVSPILLQKHEATHDLQNTCSECHISFLNKTALVTHIQQTGHAQDRVIPHWGCRFCEKRFFSENILNTHMKRSHEEEMKNEVNLEQVKTEEIATVKKEKIKILSDVKVIPSVVNQTFQVKTCEDTVIKSEIQQEQSSEAEALSNVASGIAASLGLVDTIVVLDENQFILQSQHGNIQQNILNTSDEYILPEMDIGELPTSSMNQLGQTVTLSDSNAVLTQSFHKSGINSTDELVMVLTDHDYSDGANNAVISDNNIVVLYSHPVQTQAGTMMLSDTGIIEVDKNYTQNIPITLADQQANCEESIEMIQQEINNQLDSNGVPTDQLITEATECIYEDVEMTEIDNSPQTNVTDTEIIVTKQSNSTDNDQEKVMDTITSEEAQMEMQMDQIHGETQMAVLNTDPQIQEMYNTESQQINQDDVSPIEESNLQEETETQMQETIQEEVETQENSEDEQKKDISETSQDDQAKLQEIYEETQLKMQEIHEGPKVHEVQDIQIKEIDTIESAIVQSEISDVSNTQNNEETKNIEPTVVVDGANETPISEEKVNKEETVNNAPMDELTNETTQNVSDYLKKEESFSTVPQEESVTQSDEIIPIEENILEIENNIQQIENKEQPMECMTQDYIVEANDTNEQYHLEDNKEMEKEDEKPDIKLENITSKDDKLESNETDTNNISSEEQAIETIEMKEPVATLTNETVQFTEENVNNSSYIVEANTEIEDNLMEQNQEENANKDISIDISATEESICLESTDTNSDESQIINKTDNVNFSQNESQVIEEIKISEKLPKEVNNTENVCQNKSKNENTGSQVLRNERISKILDDWDDGDTDSQQSFSKSNPQDTENSSITKLIDDWDDEEDT